MTPRTSRSAWIWLLLGGAYLVLPLVAAAEFSLKENEGYGFVAYQTIFEDPAFKETLLRSAWLALATAAVSLILLVPAISWVHLRAHRLAPAVGVISILPFFVPPIVLVAGILDVYGAALSPALFRDNPGYLIPGYVVLSFPFMFRALDRSFRALDVHALRDAAEILGASGQATFRHVILPVAAKGAAVGTLLTFVLVFGEFTMASIALFETFPVYLNDVGRTQDSAAAGLALISFGITSLAVVGLVILGRRPDAGAVHVGGAR